MKGMNRENEPHEGAGSNPLGHRKQSREEQNRSKTVKEKIRQEMTAGVGAVDRVTQADRD